MRHPRLLHAAILLWGALVPARAQKPAAPPPEPPRRPAILIPGEDGRQVPARLDSLHVSVQVAGTLATTTWDMSIANPQNRVLEGELEFPLGPGQTVSRFALEVNGSLREGVVVDKARGRQAFESTVRRGVDPGLLEMTAGNSFRARVYPIPARGTKRVVIAYEQELGFAPGSASRALVYELPVAFSDPVRDFSLDMEVAEQPEAPSFESAPLPGMAWESWKRSFRSAARARDFAPTRPVKVTIPRHAEAGASFFEQAPEGRYAYATLAVPGVRDSRPAPKRVLILWDASGSARLRDRARELELLEAHLRDLGECRVTLAIFRNTVEPLRTFTIHAGDAAALHAAIEAAPLDGATALGALKLAGQKADETLLFSDGLATFGGGEPSLPSCPLFAVNSAATFDPAGLRRLAESRGGDLVDLRSLGQEEALHRLQTLPFVFLGAKVLEGVISDVLPAPGTRVDGSFGLACRLGGRKATVELAFGHGSTVEQRKVVLLGGGDASPAPARRIWAQKRLEDLSRDPERNAAARVELACTFGLVTPETSLIVLDTVQDYARFHIEPPRELKAQYDLIVTSEKAQAEAERARHLDQILAQFEARKAWWHRIFDLLPDAKPVAPNVPPRPAPAAIPAPAPAATPAPAPAATPAPAPAPRAAAPAPASLPPPGPTGHGTGALLGVISGPNGAPVAGAAITVSNSQVTRTTITGADGGFRLGLLNPGTWQVRVSKEGFQTVTQRVDIHPQQDARFNPRLPVEASATVEVVASASVVDVTTTTQGLNISREAMAALPQARDARSMAFFAPGISGSASGNPSISGASAAENSFVVDGLTTTDYRRGDDPSAPRTEATQISAAPVRTIELKPWDPQMPYLMALGVVPSEQRYEAYLKLRESFGENPGFYLDVADLFLKEGQADLGLRILSNLAELRLEDAALLRVLGHRLQELGRLDEAVWAFELVLRMREEEPQSRRDLALACAAQGDPQRAADLLAEVAERPWDPRFQDISLIALGELNALLATSKGRLKVPGLDPRLRENLPVDARVVLNWDTNDSDMDLHIIDPRGEECFYGHRDTAQGGHLSADVTQGYGPEEFLLRNARPGHYQVRAHYYGTRQQTVIGATTVHLELYLNYGTAKVERKSVILRLTGTGRMVDVGEFVIDGKGGAK